MITITPASPAQIGRIANKMRAADVLECRALGFGPKEALRHAIKSPGEAWTVWVNGSPEAMFGLNITNALCGQAAPWMLGSDAIYHYPRDMLRSGQRLLDHWFDSFSTLSNIVSADNARAIRMLRRWGFSIGREVIMFAGTEFVTFTKER